MLEGKKEETETSLVRIAKTLEGVTALGNNTGCSRRWKGGLATVIEGKDAFRKLLERIRAEL